MSIIENIPTQNTVIGCKPSYSLEMDFESIIFDDNFKNVSSNSTKKFQNNVKISENFVIPEINYYVCDKYAFTFYEDLEVMDKFAPIPNNREIAKLSKKPQKKNMNISKEDFVIPSPNYTHDQYDTIFAEDLDYLDKYAPLENIDDCFLENNSKKSLTNNFILSERVEEKPVILAEEIEREKPAVIVSKPSSRFSSLNKVPERRNLDRILRN